MLFDWSEGEAPRSKEPQLDFSDVEEVGSAADATGADQNEKHVHNYSRLNETFNKFSGSNQNTRHPK